MGPSSDVDHDNLHRPQPWSVGTPTWDHETGMGRAPSSSLAPVSGHSTGQNGPNHSANGTQKIPETGPNPPIVPAHRVDSAFDYKCRAIGIPHLWWFPHLKLAQTHPYARIVAPYRPDGRILGLMGRVPRGLIGQVGRSKSDRKGLRFCFPLRFERKIAENRAFLAD